MGGSFARGGFDQKLDDMSQQLVAMVTERANSMLHLDQGDNEQHQPHRSRQPSAPAPAPRRKKAQIDRVQAMIRDDYYYAPTLLPKTFEWLSSICMQQYAPDLALHALSLDDVTELDARQLLKGVFSQVLTCAQHTCGGS